jgi:methylenetetrahydrofolate reductase (NADPH)
MNINELIKKDKSILSIFKENEYTYSAELIPPRNGDSINKTIQKAIVLSDAGVNFISITKGAGGSLRSGTLPISFIIKEKINVPIVAHITCMDMSLNDIENYLLDYSYLGITNMLALRGDPPTGVFSEYKASDTQFQFAYQLAEKINELNNGRYLLRKNYDKDNTDYHQGEKNDFVIGGAFYPQPTNEDINTSVDYFIKKIEKGASFGISQMIYFPNDFKIFLDLLLSKGYKIPLLPGIRVLTKINQAEFLMKNFKINIPDSYLEILKKDNNENEIIDYILDMANQFKNYGAKGIHFFVMDEEHIVSKIIKNLKK